MSSCPVCHEGIDVFAVGCCDHVICYKCSCRMRVLCEQFYCPICRTDLPQVSLPKIKINQMVKAFKGEISFWHLHNIKLKCVTQPQALGYWVFFLFLCDNDFFYYIFVYFYIHIVYNAFSLAMMTVLGRHGLKILAMLVYKHVPLFLIF